MEPAARKSDPTIHGGEITNGSNNVQIGGKKAARVGDSHTCPLHGAGIIAKVKRSVYINGRVAARKQDACLCETIQPMFHQAFLSDSDGDGTNDTAQAAFSVLRMRNEAYGDVGPLEFGAQHNLDSMYGQGKIGATVDTAGNVKGSGANASLEAGLKKQGAGFTVGMAGDKGRNPLLSVHGEYDVLHAGGNADILRDDDGSRVGLVQVVGGTAELVGGNAEVKSALPIPFTSGTAQVKANVSGSLGTAPGGGLGLWLYYDKKEKRVHFGFLIDLEAIIAGAGVNLDFSVGQKYGGAEQVGPNFISGGFDSVLIGD